MKKLAFLLILLITITVYGQAGDEMPTYKGGIQSLIDFISKHIKYPEHARDLKIQGRVVVNFIVETDGTVTNITLVEGIGGGCDAEAMRVIGLTSGNWFPGRQDGELIRVSYNAPVKFTLDEEPMNSAEEFNKGVDFMRAENYEEAIRAFNLALQQDEYCNKCIYSRGLSKFLMGDFKNAILDWELALKHDYAKKDISPKLTEAYMKVGNDFLAENKYSRAIVMYSKALSYTPNETNVLNNRANAYFYLGEKEKACDDWNQIKKLGSTEVDELLKAYCE
ncbi:MAG: hypothetical protein COW63_04995 [Bacteroidetes bacterium CG18_big_fil_WC_8_21_14_2_50_41_14]|nr:MAG: hypothetical protein COW63_04995 [Bacteroidetes bacterium CG18_big_fil_WC_8_21_14_2_50_41_14]PIY30845.1 MAG: hypothetical protein COZ08_10600 [Bacteroidetes bacterium CG_4_10_14_3_um_filter_42_6]PJB57225.1 MAG: hypothetical protein CO098_12235 [Bacteroidetes bacterium CG_4_9_14_3_um_filter_41_19]